MNTQTADSPRWCESCDAYGDHHPDRHEMFHPVAKSVVWGAVSSHLDRVNASAIAEDVLEAIRVTLRNGTISPADLGMESVHPAEDDVYDGLWRVPS